MQDLTSYPRPNVAVDVAVLTVLASPDPKARAGSLAVLVHERVVAPHGLVLPGRFLRENETIRECVAITLRDKAGIKIAAAEPRLLGVFDNPGRDPRAWTLSLAHYVVLPPERLQSATGDLLQISPAGSLRRGIELLFDHPRIVEKAATAMQERYELSPDPDQLITGPFTLLELRTVHEAVLGEQIRRDTFRRRMEPQLAPYLEAGQHASRIDRGRPARLWTRQHTDEVPETARPRLSLPRA